MPQATFNMQGDIEDFKQVDNFYSAMKREGEKLLKQWTIKFDINFTESEGEVKI